MYAVTLSHTMSHQLRHYTASGTKYKSMLPIAVELLMDEMIITAVLVTVIKDLHNFQTNEHTFINRHKCFDRIL